MDVLESYPHGSRPVATATFTDLAVLGRTTLACTFKLRDPSGDETSYVYGIDASVTNPSTNVFRFECPKLTVDGYWYVRAVASSGFDAPAETRFYVERSAFTTP